MLLVFYPRDNTPGCTQEGEDFAAAYSQFKKAKTLIFGISADSMEAHEKFKRKMGFPFELLSDPPGGLVWLVYGHRRNGETPIRAEGRTRAEAWQVTVRQARTLGSGGSSND